MLRVWSSKKTTGQSQAQLINGAARFHQTRDTRGPRSGGPMGFSVSSLATRSTARCTWLAPAAGDVRRPRHCRMRPSAGWGPPLKPRAADFTCLGEPARPASRFRMLLPRIAASRVWPLLRVKFHGNRSFSRSLTRNRHMQPTSGVKASSRSDSGGGCNCHCIP